MEETENVKWCVYKVPQYNRRTLTLSDLSIILKQSSRHMALSHLVALSISSPRNLDIEANKFHDRAHRFYDAAIITRCYTQRALRPNIDSEVNHIRHFIKIQFVNKGIEFINLPSIFKDKSSISSIPTYFENKESPIICYKYNKPILNASKTQLLQYSLPQI